MSSPTHLCAEEQEPRAPTSCPAPVIDEVQHLFIQGELTQPNTAPDYFEGRKRTISGAEAESFPCSHFMF